MKMDELNKYVPTVKPTVDSSAIPNSSLPTPESRLQTTEYSLATPVSRLQTPDSRLLSVLSGLPPLLIPILFLAWSLYLNHLAGPFYQNRSDPEYPYLLNGLNCATLDFSRIGHTDHPGTPFQVLTGVFIRITHTLAGQGPIAEDVFSRPEVYLSWSSFFLSLLTFFALWWLGRIAIRNGRDLNAALVMQSSVLLSSVLIDFPMRYNPDRILVVYTLIFIGLMYKFLYTKTLSERTFIISSGVLMGIGFATKFNFLPLVVLPVILVPKFRRWIQYGLTFLVTGFICILPIINKFSEFRRFIGGVATHDGLYGQGTEQMINWHSFFNNIGLIFKYNIVFGVILIFSVVIGIYLLVSTIRRKSHLRELLFLAGFWVAALAGFLMVAKHFKNYYFGPVLALAGFAFLVQHRIISGLSKSDKPSGPEPFSVRVLLSLLVVVLVTAFPLFKDYKARKAQISQNQMTVDFMRKTIGRDDILLVEPTWMAGPMVENALVYGISYVAHREQYYQELSTLYPNVVTWEGRNQPFRLFRTVPADPEAILRSGKVMYLFTSPGRYPEEFLATLDSLAGHYAITLSRDTLFTNSFNQDRIISFRHDDSWKTLDNLQNTSPGETVLDAGSRNSSELIFSDVRTGDYFEATVRIRTEDPDPAQIILRSQDPAADGVFFSDSHTLYDIGDNWKLLRLRARISQLPAGGKMICHVYFPGKSKIEMNTFRCSRYGIRDTPGQ